MVRFRTASLLVVFLFTGAAAAQPDDCPRQWTPGWTKSGLDGTVTAMTPFDLDGPGPAGPTLILAGDFFSTDGVAVKSPVAWTQDGFVAMQAGLISASISGFDVLDADGAGPVGPELYAWGRFTLPGDPRTATVGVVRWTAGAGGEDGHWSRLGTPLIGLTDQAAVVGLALHDFDGDGPASPRLVAVSADNSTRGSVQAWDGVDWVAVGSNNRFTGINGIASVDHDGAGPNPPVLYVSAGTSGLMRLAGSSWEPVAGLNASIDGIVSFDLDGAGPQTERLVAATGSSVLLNGYLTTVGTYDGANWQGLGPPGVTDRCLLKAVPGPLPGSPPSLMLMPRPSALLSVYRWTNSAPPPGAPPAPSSWQRLAAPSSIRQSSASNGGIRTIAYFDADGVAAGPAELIVGGSFDVLGDVLTKASLLSISDGSWRPLTRFSAVPDGAVLAIKAFDPDGAGLQAEKLFVGGRFATIANRAASAFATWDGREWQSVGEFSSGSAVNVMEIYDDDGDGPRPPGLIVGGRFATVDGVQYGNIARLGAEGWTPLGSGLQLPQPAPDGVSAMSVVDLDGPGPQQASLLVASDAQTVNGLGSATIAAWDGDGWTPMGTGAPLRVVGFGVFAQDGAPPRVIAVGANGALSLWNGSAWQSWASTTGSIRFATMIDEDGNGPMPAGLLIGGNFGTVAGTWAYPGLARYNGQSWSAVTVGNENNRAFTAGMIDLDGPGPDPARPVLAGEFSNSGGALHSLAVMHVDSGGLTTFELMGGYVGPNGYMAMAAFADEPGQQPSIFLAGNFTGVDRFASSGALAAGGLARFGCPPCIAFTTQPAGRDVRAGRPITLTAVAASDDAELTYRWRRDGTELTDGGGIAGATTTTLAISSTRVADSGVYDLRVTALCGTMLSAGAVVSVSCSGDFNADGHIGIDDIIGFIQAYLTGDLSADFSGDYHLSLQDLFDFLGAYFVGC